MSPFMERVWWGTNVGKYNIQTWNSNKISERHKKTFKVMQTPYTEYRVN